MMRALQFMATFQMLNSQESRVYSLFFCRIYHKFAEQARIMDWNEEKSFESDVLIEEEVDSSDPAQLIVYNDDYNTFDWVIQCFVEVLNHTVEQSEQLSLMIHFKGKAIVKTGQFEKLKKWRRQLVDRGLNAVVELIPT